MYYGMKCICVYCLIHNVTDPPSPPLNPMLVEFENKLTLSIVVLQWDRPSTTGGVDICYVVTVSPPPVSGSTIIYTQSRIAEITVSYNTQYNVTIRAENINGSSDDAIVMFEIGKTVYYYYYVYELDTVYSVCKLWSI